jgi:pimeloyl-ACP methyl ester carboxylesterase
LGWQWTISHGSGGATPRVIGNSLGGLYALGFATRHPQRVAHLILAGAPAAHDHPVPLPVRLVAGRITGRLLRPVLSRMSVRGTRRGEGRLLVAHAERLTDDYLEVSAATTRRNAAVWPSYRRWAVQGRAIHPDMPAPVWAATAARSGVPLTYLWGAEDRFVPIGHGRRLARAIGADVVEVAEAGHLVWLDQPRRCAEAVRSILA